MPPLAAPSRHAVLRDTPSLNKSPVPHAQRAPVRRRRHARNRALKLFTLAVLLASLLSAWITGVLSLAFGAFLTRMMLGATELPPPGPVVELPVPQSA